VAVSSIPDETEENRENYQAGYLVPIWDSNHYLLPIGIITSLTHL